MSLFGGSSVGVEITDSRIRLALLKRGLNRIQLGGVSEIQIPHGIVTNGIIQHKNHLSALFKEAAKELYGDDEIPRRVVFSLPDALLTFSETKTEHENESLLSAEEAAVKSGIDTASHSYAVSTYESEDGERAAIVSVARSELVQWHDFFHDLGVKHIVVDIAPYAVARSVFVRRFDSGKCLVSLEENAATVSMLADHRLVIYARIPYDSTAFRSALTEAALLDRQLQEARDYPEASEIVSKKIFPLLASPLSNVITAITEARKLFEERFGRHVSEMVFSGIGVTSRVFTETMQSQLGLWARVAKPMVLMSRRAKVSIPHPQNINEFVLTLGLALRDLDNTWSRDPKLSLSENSLSRDFPKKKSGKASANMFHFSRYAFSFFALILLISLGWWVSLRTEGGAMLVSMFKKNDPTVEAPLVPVVPPSGSSVPADIVEETGVPADAARVRILDTDTGWLNVRSGPSTVYDITRKVFPGEIYAYLEESQDWYRIKLNDGKDGWVIKEFAERVQ